jgi:hypothetical protein
LNRGDAEVRRGSIDKEARNGEEKSQSLWITTEIEKRIEEIERERMDSSDVSTICFWLP